MEDQLNLTQTIQNRLVINDSPVRHIIIVGAGISGLATALSLAKEDIQITILEKAKTLSKEGAGIQLSPNATKVLEEYGLLQELLSLAIQPTSINLRSGINKDLYVSLDLENYTTKLNTPYLVVHRAKLQKLLYEAAIKNANIKVYFNQNIKSIEVSDAAVNVTALEKSELSNFTADILIGCDGVFSQVRDYFLPTERAVFSGYYAWRLNLNFDIIKQHHLDLADDHTVSAWLKPSQHMITYPLVSGEQLNIVNIIKGSTADTPTHHPHKVKASELQRAFKLWHKDFKFLAAQSGWVAWPIFISYKPRYKINDRVYLLGDASHAISPFAAQGAAMALEDAPLFAMFITSKLTIEQFLAIRHKRLRKIDKRTKLNIMSYHAKGIRAWIRNKILRFRNNQEFLHDLDWLYGYDSTKLSAQTLYPYSTL